MSTFKAREEKEEIAEAKFNQWLKKGNWVYHHFRYPKDLTLIEISDPEIKKALKKVDFNHDGIMSRRVPQLLEAYLFDLKYKSKAVNRNLVNVKDYDAYYTLSQVVPFLIVAYTQENDNLYFHRVRNPQKIPKPTVYYDDRPAEYGGEKWVYQIPEEEYCLISGFDIPFKTPKSMIDYIATCRQINAQFIAWENKTAFTPRPLEEYRREIMEEWQEDRTSELWGLNTLNVPKASTQMLEELENYENKEKLKRLTRS